MNQFIARLCPFCEGHTDIEYLGCDKRVYCVSCHAKGPRSPSIDEAIFLWNRRPGEVHYIETITKAVEVLNGEFINESDPACTRF